ncbi:MAG: type II secretion system F family protein, partial [Methylococcales bacterium]
LKDLTETLSWQDELIVQTKKALTLPAFMAVVIFLVVFFLMTFLVPQLVSFISTMGQELPLHTKILIAVSDFFVANWFWVLSTPVVLFISFQQLIKRNAKAQLLFDRYKLKVWVFGPIIEKIILARFANYFALLYQSGIPVIESLKITESIVDNKAIELALYNIRTMVTEGATIGLAFEMSQIFPRLVMSMINVGEKTGDLSTSLQNVSYFYKRDVDDAIDNLQTMIEPAMTIIMGSIIGWIMVSVLGPIYDLISNIKM